MKSLWIVIVIAAIVIVGALFWFNALRGSGQGDDVAILQESSIEGDLMSAGRNVMVQTQIPGDLAVAGSNVNVAGMVNGYLLAAGSEVSVNAPVGNDLWAAGARVEVNAPVADSARLAGNTVILHPQATIGRDASIAGNSIQVLGRVQRNLRVAAAEASLASEIGGSVEARAGNLKLLPGAVIHGDLLVIGPAPPEIAPEAKVLGRVQHQREEASSGWSVTGFLGQWVFIFLALVVLGAATIALAALWPERIVAQMKRRPGLALLAGLAVLILIPITCVVLALTVIGIPLSILLLALYVVALLLAGVFVSYLVGGFLLRLLNRPQKSPYAALAAGALLTGLLVSLPFIGWLFQLLVLLIGVGALVLERKDAWHGQTAAGAV